MAPRSRRASLRQNGHATHSQVGCVGTDLMTILDMLTWVLAAQVCVHCSWTEGTIDTIGHFMVLFTVHEADRGSDASQWPDVLVFPPPLDRQMGLYTRSPLGLSVPILINHAHYKRPHMGICRQHPSIVHVSLSKLRLPLVIRRAQNFSSTQP